MQRYRGPVKCETKQKRNETIQVETDQNESKQNETKQIEPKRNKSKQTKQRKWVFLSIWITYLLIAKLMAILSHGLRWAVRNKKQAKIKIKNYMSPPETEQANLRFSNWGFNVGLCNIIGLPVYCNILVSNTYCNTFFCIAIYCVLSLWTWTYEFSMFLCH